MGCGCSQRAEGLLGKLGFSKEGIVYIYHSEGITVRFTQDKLDNHHFVLTLIGWLARLAT